MPLEILNVDKLVFATLEAVERRAARLEESLIELEQVLPADSLAEEDVYLRLLVERAELYASLPERLEATRRFYPIEIHQLAEDIDAATRAALDAHIAGTFESWRQLRQLPGTAAKANPLTDLLGRLRASEPPPSHPAELGFRMEPRDHNGESRNLWLHCNNEARLGYRQMELDHESRQVPVMECIVCGVRFEKLPERRNRRLVTV